MLERTQRSVRKTTRIQADAALHNGTYQDPNMAKALVDPSEQSSIGVIASAAEMQELFVRYPKLQAQLYAIYDASLEHNHREQYPSNHRRDNSSRGRGQSCHRPCEYTPKQHWTPEKGIEKALKKFQWCLQVTDADAIGLEDFCKTVTKLRAAGQYNHT